MSIIDEIEYNKEHRELLDSNFSFNSAWYINYKSYVLANSIRISKEIFPDIHDLLDKTVSQIDSANKYEFFITSDHSFNAKCVSLTKNNAIIVINSRVIELLNTNELAFIVGHEIAHHYYKHYSLPDVDMLENIEIRLGYLSVMRDAELSCDRLGLMCVDTFEIAARAIIKIVSGLSDKFIENNFKKYLSQLKEISSDGFIEEQYQTHNNWLIRLQCLYLFSNSDVYNSYKNNDTASCKTLTNINSIIKDGLDNLTKSKNSQHFSDQENDMFCWILLYLTYVHDENLLINIKNDLNKINLKKSNKIHYYLMNNSSENIKKKINSLLKNYQQLPLTCKNNALKKISDYLDKYNINSIVIESKFEFIKKELI